MPEMTTPINEIGQIFVGDRVEIIRGNSPVDGRSATVVSVSENQSILSLDVDDWEAGHSADGRARKGHGWNVHFTHVNIIIEESGLDRLVDNLIKDIYSI